MAAILERLQDLLTTLSKLQLTQWFNFTIHCNKTMQLMLPVLCNIKLQVKFMNFKLISEYYRSVRFKSANALAKNHEIRAVWDSICLITCIK